MDMLRQGVDFLIHIDVHLHAIIQQYGVWTYAILTAIVFCETGFVVTPFLPGDSLLFAAGAFAAQGALHPVWLFMLLSKVGLVVIVRLKRLRPAPVKSEPLHLF